MRRGCVTNEVGLSARRGCRGSGVEHPLGKGEVESSNLSGSTIRTDMTDRPDIATLDVIAPNLKRRMSGVTSTVARLVPVQARSISIAAAGPGLPDWVPTVTVGDVVRMPRAGPSGARVWHARRNVEMIAGLALKQLLRKRLRLVFTSAAQRRHSGLTKALIRRMDAVVATSAKAAAYLDRPAPVIRHGVDADAFRPPADRDALRRRLGLPVDAVIAGCMGRIRHNKGTDLFVDAMLRLMPTRPALHAVVTGRAVEKDAGFVQGLRDRIGGAGLADRFHIPGEVAFDAVPDWFGTLDLYVAPQRWEGFGLTPLESMACGVPVVATTVGAFEELVADGETGRLVAPGDLDALAGCMMAMLDDAALRRAMGEAGRARVEASFRLEHEAAALVAVYRDLLTGSWS